MLLENIGENFEGPSWSNRIFFYFCLFSSLLIIFLLVFISFTAINPDFAIPNGPHYNSTELRNMGFFDNERYLISALVQSLAATIALVITLSLVAVQLAAQSYSARVIDVYKNNPDMWILLSIYIVVIFYGLGLLKVIDIGVAGINMEFAIFAAYSLGFFAFICLVPYMLKTLDLLKPSTVIKLLAAEITKERILESLEEDGEIAEKDPVQPIIDMINAALRRNDYETVRNGLQSIKISVFQIFENVNIENSDKEELVARILKHIKWVGIQATKMENEDSALSAIQNLSDIGIKATEIKLEQTAEETVNAIGIIGTKSIETKLEKAAGKAVIQIGNVGVKAAKMELEEATKKSIIELEKMGIKAIDKGYEWIASASVKELGSIEIKVIDKGVKLVAWEGIIVLGKLGTKAVENGFEWTTGGTLIVLGDIETIALKESLSLIAEFTRKEIEKLSEHALKKGLNDIIRAATEVMEISSNDN